MLGFIILGNTDRSDANYISPHSFVKIGQITVGIFNTSAKPKYKKLEIMRREKVRL